MRRRGYTLIETAITSGVLLLMVGMASVAIIFYLRSYRQYTEQSLRVRLSARTLEVACYRLRSAQSLLLPVPTSLQTSSLRFMNSDGVVCALHLDQGKLWHQQLDSQGKVQGAQSLGAVKDLEAKVQGRFLVLRAQVEGSNLPLETQLSLRGIAQQ